MLPLITNFIFLALYIGSLIPNFTPEYKELVYKIDWFLIILNLLLQIFLIRKQFIQHKNTTQIFISLFFSLLINISTCATHFIFISLKSNDAYLKFKDPAAPNQYIYVIQESFISDPTLKIGIQKMPWPILKQTFNLGEDQLVNWNQEKAIETAHSLLLSNPLK